MKKHKNLLIVAAIMLLPVCALAGGPPAWLQQAAVQSTSAIDLKNVPAVVLLNEESVVVTSDGAILTTKRYAVRVLEREGRAEAIASVVYRTDSDKVRDLSAWLLRASGQPKEYGKKETIDIAVVANDLYNEARRRVISARDDADVGDVFGFESVQEERTIFSQFQYLFQDNLATAQSRFNLTLPAGWRAESVTINGPKLEPSVTGTTYRWEMRNLGPIRWESRSPHWSSLAPRLAVSFFTDQPVSSGLKTFANWQDVARWMSEIEDPQMTVDDALAAKARDLTANAKTEFEKLQAVSKYVQGLQYISIQVGTGRGGGYKPRSATEVFAKSYGDCKDKANLLRAMLSVLKIESYLISITADDPTYVRAEWPSPHQFNHCIIAIRITDATQVPSVAVHPKLGRLLIFDATDPHTPIGDLPEDEQGSLALIDHKDTDALIRMPVIPAEKNRLDRRVEVALSPTGGIVGTVSERTNGQSARTERARLRELSSVDYNRVIEGWISRGASGAKTTSVTPTDNHSEGTFDLKVDFTAASYAQVMQGRLMVFKPAIVGRLERFSVSAEKRMNPFLIDPTSYTENVMIKLPDGYVIDEMPEPTNLAAAFGTYSAKYAIKDNMLQFERTLTLNRAEIPADKYQSVMDFFGRVHAAEQSPVVLIRK